MAVQAPRLAQGFPYDLHATAAAASGAGALFFDELSIVCAPPPPAVAGIGSAVFGDVPRSVLTCNGDSGGEYGFVERKRPRVAAGGLFDDPRVALASTSGRVSGGGADGNGISQGLLSQLYHHGVEIDALVRLEAERMRLGLEEAQRRHVRALASAAARATAGRARAAEAELERARCRNAELEERLRQVSAEGQAWMGVARSHVAVAAGLRATIDQLLLHGQSSSSPPCAGDAGDAEDARSCCFETPPGAGNADDALSKRAAVAATSCKACHGADACVLLLPCRHLCLCGACDAAVDACPVCAAAKNDSVHVLLS